MKRRILLLLIALNVALWTNAAFAETEEPEEPVCLLALIVDC